MHITYQIWNTVLLSATDVDVKEAVKLITNGEYNAPIATSLKVAKPLEDFVIIDE